MCFPPLGARILKFLISRVAATTAEAIEGLLLAHTYTRIYIHTGERGRRRRKKEGSSLHSASLSFSSFSRSGPFCAKSRASFPYFSLRIYAQYITCHIRCCCCCRCRSPDDFFSLPREYICVCGRGKEREFILYICVRETFVLSRRHYFVSRCELFLQRFALVPRERSTRAVARIFPFFMRRI